MARNSQGNIAPSQRRFSVLGLLQRAVAGNSSARRVSAALMFDVLESRQLLSASGISHPLYVLYHPVATIDAVANVATEVSPAEMRQAYGVNSIAVNGVVGDGTGQTIAIVDAFKDPTIATDLATFDSMFGIAAPPNLVVIRQDGSLVTSTNQPPTDNVDPAGNSWAVETSLDVEWAHVIAPKANILLVLANDSGNGLYTAVTEAGNYTGTAGVARASVVSMSWGGSDLGGTTDSTFTHAGVSYVASSGDGGAYTTNGGASYPASSPNVLAVGGTTLQLSGGNYSSESAWSGSGGGLSSVESEPGYQLGVVPGTLANGHRALPDVSMDADPNSGVAVVDSFDLGNSNPIQVGGTSLAAPMWAGLLAIANQERVGSGLQVLNTNSSDSTLSMIYGLPSADFHDVTTGSNGHAATAGFDLATGRGTPIANLLIPGLVGNTTVQPAPVVNALTISPASITVGATTAITLTANATDTTAATITGVKFYTSAGTLLGAGTQSGSNWSFIISGTSSLAAGTYKYYSVATDSASLSTPTGTSAINATLTVNAPVQPAPVVNSLTISPASITVGATTAVTLTANATDTTAATISTVKFYTSGGTLLGTGTKSGNNWTFAIASTNSLAVGSYKYYAVATDSASLSTPTGTSAINVTLTVNPAVVAPANDNFANATVLSGKTVAITGTNVNATKQTGEPNIAGNAGGKSVWYVWTATASGKVSLNTTGSNFDTLLGVYTGTSVSALTLVASNDDASNSVRTSSLTFTVVAGTTYHFAVDGYNYGTGAAAGNITLNLSQAAAPANDNFANATALTGTSATVTGTNVGATRETGEPSPAGVPSNASVWFTWTATSNGTVSLNTHGSSFDTVLGVYTGTSVSSLTAVASNDDDPAGGTLTSALTFNAVAGATYHFVVAGYSTATGNITLNLSQTVSATKPAGGSSTPVNHGHAILRNRFI